MSNCVQPRPAATRPRHNAASVALARAVRAGSPRELVSDIYPIRGGQGLALSDVPRSLTGTPATCGGAGSPVCPIQSEGYEFVTDHTEHQSHGPLRCRPALLENDALATAK